MTPQATPFLSVAKGPLAQRLRRLTSASAPGPASTFTGPTSIVVPDPRDERTSWTFVYSGSCAGCSRPLYCCSKLPAERDHRVDEALMGISDHIGVPVEAMGGYPDACLLVCQLCMVTPARSAKVAQRLRGLSERLRQRESQPIAGLP